jgi:WD40 repeat protein
VTADKLVATVALGGIGAKSLAFSPDNTTLAIAKVRSVELWDVAMGTLADRWEDEMLQALDLDEYPDLEQIAFSPDGRFLAVAGDQLLVTLASDKSPVLS